MKALPRGAGMDGRGALGVGRRQGCHRCLPTCSAHCSPNKASTKPPFPEQRRATCPAEQGAGGAAVPSGWGCGCPPVSAALQNWLHQNRPYRSVTYIHPHKGSRAPVLVPSQRPPRLESHSRAAWQPQAHGHPPAFEHPARSPPQLEGRSLEDGGGSLLGGQGDAGGARLRAGQGWSGIPGAQRRRARSGQRTPGAGWVQACLAAAAKPGGTSSGEFFGVCLYNISRLQFEPCLCPGSSLQGARCPSPC